jgi:hypothetical protein
LTAKEANQQSALFGLMLVIFNDISTACKNGKYSVNVRCLSDEAIRYLGEQGYKVSPNKFWVEKDGEEFLEQGWMISW